MSTRIVELERLFRHGRLTRRQFVSGLAALGLTASSVELLLGSGEVAAESETPKAAEYLVLIVLDAFRGDYQSLQPMPTLSALAASGTSYDRAWVGQLESYTPTGHATISTGTVPRNHGIIGFEWEDTSGAERLDAWAPGALAGELERDLRESGVPSIPFAVKAADPHARIVALSSEKPYAAEAMGGWAGDYTLYLQHTQNHDLAIAGLPGHIPPQGFGLHSTKPISATLLHLTDWDYLSTMMALASLQQIQPRVLMINLPGADVYGHKFGGPATPTAMKAVIAGLDRNIARIVDAYKAADIFDRTLFVITADHGMIPNDRAVDGSVQIDAVHAAGAQYFFHTGGTAAEIYVHDPAHASKVAAQMLKLQNVTAAYYRARSGSSYEYATASGMKLDATLDAAYQYLLGTFLGPTSPQVVAPFRENTIGKIHTAAYGDHGGLSWGAQHIPLVMAGPGVPVGQLSHHPARLIDVAPTILRLMGLRSPGPMDGAVLADAVTDATADEVAAQASLGVTLTAHQNALIQQAMDNIEEDKKAGVKPPPSQPIRP